MDDFALGSFRADIEPERYMSMVRRTLEYIAAGDIFQANIAQGFTAEFSGSPRALALEGLRRARPWYGAYLELAAERARQRSILSFSPELFLELSAATRRITTRPIKGTRRASDSPHELHRSTKDAAELHMIVDLMRNDLGRVCELGSVRAPSPRSIETHQTVHHGVAEVTGRLRPDASVGDILGASFPAGSVTGAPKIRAMQIIDELESSHAPHSPRGPYCGAIGYISDCGSIGLSVAIRTATIEPGVLHYFAGAGIVADSDPLAEHRETLDKTAVIQSLVSDHSKAAPVGMS